MVSELRKSILENEDIQQEIVAVPEWGGTKLEVRGMNGKDRASFLRRSTDSEGNIAYENFYPELLIATLFDPESGEKVFEPADRDALNQKSGAALERLAIVAQRLSGLGVSDVEAAEGNSEGSQSNGST